MRGTRRSSANRHNKEDNEVWRTQNRGIIMETHRSVLVLRGDPCSGVPPYGFLTAAIDEEVCNSISRSALQRRSTRRDALSGECKGRAVSQRSATSDDRRGVHQPLRPLLLSAGYRNADDRG